MSRAHGPRSRHSPPQSRIDDLRSRQKSAFGPSLLRALPSAILALLCCKHGVTRDLGTGAEPALGSDDLAVLAEEVSELARLVDRRLSYMKDVAAYKWANGLPIEDLERERVVLEKSAQGAAAFGLDPASVRPFVRRQMELAKQIQSHWFQRWTQEDSAPREFRDLTTEVRPDLLSLGDDILRAIAELAPWQHSAGALEGLQPVFVDGIANELLSYEQKSQLFRAVQAIDAATKEVSPSGNPSTRPPSRSDNRRKEACRHVQSTKSPRDALASAR